MKTLTPGPSPTRTSARPGEGEKGEGLRVVALMG